MPDRFVSKGGSDSNDGLTLGTAFKTIGKAITDLVPGPVTREIEVHPGYYNESLQGLNVTNSNRAYTITGVGHVVVDGQGISRCLVSTGSGPNPGSGLFHTLNNLEFRNYIDSFFDDPTNGNALQIEFNNCRFYGSFGAQTCLENNVSNSGNTFYKLNDCLIVGFRTGLAFKRGDLLMKRSTVDVRNNSNMSGSRCVTGGDGNSSMNYSSCLLITDDGVCSNHNSASLGQMDYNRYWVTGTGHVGFRSGAFRTTLANWQAVSAKDPNSTEGDPLISDLSYIPTTTSPLIDAGVPLGAGLFETIGPFRPGFTISDNDNSGLWGGAAEISNVVFDAGSGKFKLAEGETVGTVATDVLDMTERKRVRRLFAYGNEDPLNTFTAFDTSTGDIDMTLEFRLQDTSFLKADGTPTWQEVPRTGDLNQVGRYIQFRVTLRSDNDLV